MYPPIGGSAGGYDVCSPSPTYRHSRNHAVDSYLLARSTSIWARVSSSGDHGIGMRMIFADSRRRARCSSFLKMYSSRSSPFQYARTPSNTFAPRVAVALMTCTVARSRGTISPLNQSHCASSAIALYLPGRPDRRPRALFRSGPEIPRRRRRWGAPSPRSPSRRPPRSAAPRRCAPTSRRCGARRMSAQRSPTAASRSNTVEIVHRSGSNPARSSSHVTGTLTVA